MFAANTYRIRRATDSDSEALRRLAERNSQQPLGGRVLIGELDGVEGAALALSDGRVIADHSPRADQLVANLRMRAVAIWAHEAMPSLRDRLLTGLPAWYRAVAVPTSEATPDDGQVEHERMLVQS